MSNDLFEEFLDQLTYDELSSIVAKRNIPIEGFRSNSNNIPITKLKSGIKNFLSKYHSKIMVQDRESYLNLQKKNIHSFNLQILHDLYNNINTELIEKIIKELANSKTNDLKIVNENSEKSSLQEENEKLNKKINDLNKALKDNQKQLRQKQEEFVQNDNKLKNEQKRLNKLIDKLNNKVKEELMNVANLKKDCFNYSSEIERLNNENEYYKHLMKRHKVILFKLYPKGNSNFPYLNVIVNDLEYLKKILLQEEFSEIWYLENSLNPLETNWLFGIIKKENINIKIIHLNNKDLEILKIGVGEYE